MADVAGGLTVGGPEGLDPNEPEAFAKIMEGRGVEREEGEENAPDRSIASGLTTAEPGQERGPDGRFVPKEEANGSSDTPVVAATETLGGEHGELTDDPEVQEVLSKYGGDVGKALKGLAGAQSLIGKRDEEREQLRTEVAELRGLVTGLAAKSASPTAVLTDDQVVEIATTQITEKGYATAASEAANHGHTTGDERAYRAILEQWTLESPVDAMDFNTDFRIWQRDQRTATAAPAEQPAWAVQAEQTAATEEIVKTITAVAAERGVAKDSPIIEKMLDALEEMPKNVLQMVGSDDPEAKAAGVRLVMDRATLLAGAAAQATPAPADVPVPAAVARKLAGAAVASGALRPAETATASTEQTLAQAKAEFKRQIIEAPTTNIESGLTYGPQP